MTTLETLEEHQKMLRNAYQYAQYYKKNGPDFLEYYYDSALRIMIADLSKVLEEGN